MGVLFNVSYDLEQPAVYIRSHLNNVLVSVAAIPGGTAQAKKEVYRLVSQLQEMLLSVPAASGEDAKKLTRRVEALVEELKENRPEEEEIKTRSKSLAKAAQNLAQLAPAVPSLITRFIEYIPELLRLA